MQTRRKTLYWRRKALIVSLGRRAMVGRWVSAKGCEEGEARVENGRLWDVTWPV